MWGIDKLLWKDYIYVDMLGELASRLSASHREKPVRCPTYSLLKGKITEAQYERALRDMDTRFAYGSFSPRTRTASEQ